MMIMLQALTKVGESLNLMPENYYGKDDEDPVEWFKKFNYAAAANNWMGDERKLQIVLSFLKGQALHWFEEVKDDIRGWEKKEKDGEESEEKEDNDRYNTFEEAFLKKFVSREKRRSWRRQLDTLKQGETSVGLF